MTRDSYVALLEKRATTDEDVLHEAIPSNNSAETADIEHNQNREDHRNYLHSIFSNASRVQENQSSELRKLFPGLSNKTVTSNPLIKVASRQTFITVLQGHGNFLKTAAPLHIEVAFNAFQDELEKISNALSPLGGGSLAKALPGQMGISQASRMGTAGNALHTARNMGQAGNALQLGHAPVQPTMPQPQVLR